MKIVIAVLVVVLWCGVVKGYGTQSVNLYHSFEEQRTWWSFTDDNAIWHDTYGTGTQKWKISLEQYNIQTGDIVKHEGDGDVLFIVEAMGKDHAGFTRIQVLGKGQAVYTNLGNLFPTGIKLPDNLIRERKHLEYLGESYNRLTNNRESCYNKKNILVDCYTSKPIATDDHRHPEYQRKQLDDWGRQEDEFIKKLMEWCKKEGIIK